MTDTDNESLTAETRVVTIDLYRDPDAGALWGADGPDDERYDTEASEARLEALTLAALRAEYPDATIEYRDGDGLRTLGVRLTIPDIGEVSADDSDEAAEIEDTIGRIHADMEWVVERVCQSGPRIAYCEDEDCPHYGKRLVDKGYSHPVCPGSPRAGHDGEPLWQTHDPSRSDYRDPSTRRRWEMRSPDRETEDTLADTAEEALDECEEWLRDGAWDYGYLNAEVAPYVDGEPDYDASEIREIIVGEPEPEPDCDDDGGHDWQTPHAVVGGCTENPGVWSRGGSQIATQEVCAHCGRYRDTVSESTPGQHPRTPERVTYSEADEASRAWVATAE